MSVVRYVDAENLIEILVESKSPHLAASSLSFKKQIKANKPSVLSVTRLSTQYMSGGNQSDGLSLRNPFGVTPYVSFMFSS